MGIFDDPADHGPKASASLEGRAPPVDLGRCRGLWSGEFSLLELPTPELARQLTVWSSTRFYNIKRSELLDCAWNKPRLKYRAPNVIALTEHFVKFSHWAEFVILSERDKRRRHEKIEQLLALANNLFDMNNFFHVSSLVSGFESNELYDLIRGAALSKESKEIMKRLELIRTIDGNFKELRNLNDQALASGKPALPYLGVLLSDLVKYYDGTPTWVNGLINVKKVKGVYKLINFFEEFFKHKYCFYPIDQVLAKIDALPNYDEHTLSAMFSGQKEGYGELSESS
jgi:hypothetical protein